MAIKIICDAGINANGSLDSAKKLIDIAVLAGADLIKFQKRIIDETYNQKFLDSPRESPWGRDQRAQKNGLEFNHEQYDEIDSYCKSKGIEWFASAWSIGAQDFLSEYECKYNKIASPMLTNLKFVERVLSERKYTFISTGMSTILDIEKVVKIARSYEYHTPFSLMHCVSTYPMKDEHANLRCIKTLASYFNCDCGYSDHAVGLQISLAAVALGATSIERHITLNRTDYGSDQSASLEPGGLIKLVRDIRVIENAMGMGEKILTEYEQKVKDKFEQCSLK